MVSINIKRRGQSHPRRHSHSLHLQLSLSHSDSPRRKHTGKKNPYLLLILRKIPRPQSLRFAGCCTACTVSIADSPVDTCRERSGVTGVDSGSAFSPWLRLRWRKQQRLRWPLSPRTALGAVVDDALELRRPMSGDEEDKAWRRSLLVPQSSISCISFCAMESSLDRWSDAPVFLVALLASILPELPKHHSVELAAKSGCADGGAVVGAGCGGVVWRCGPPTASGGCSGRLRVLLLRSLRTGPPTVPC